MRRLFVFVFFFGALLVLPACQKESAHRFSPQVQKQVALLPTDADVIGFLDIQAMQKSGFFDFITDSLKAELNEDEDFKALMDELGLEPKKDIQRMYFAAHYKGEDNLQVLLITEGNFQPQKILAKIEKETTNQDVKKTTYDKYELYLFPKDKAFAFTDNQRMITGSVQWVKLYLDKLSDRQPALTSDLKKRIEKLPYTNQAWLLTRIGQWTKKIENESEHPRLEGLSSLQQLDFAMDLNEQLRFYSQATFDNREMCQLFTDAVKGLIAAGKLAVSENRSVVDVLNKIDIQNDGLNLEVRFEISHDDFQKLLDSKKNLAIKI